MDWRPIAQTVTKYGIPLGLAGGALYLADETVTMVLKDYKWPVVVVGAIGVTYLITTGQSGDMFMFPK